MKRIRIATGIKRIEGSETSAGLFRLRDVLSEHRTVLVSRILSDIPTYINYKFQVKADAKQVEAVKENLLSLKGSVLDLERYRAVVDHFHDHEMTYAGSEPFMHEIDEHIAMALNLPQLKLVG